MSREIKFRVWTGTNMEHNIMAGFLGAFYVQGVDENDTASMSPFNTRYSEECPLMQYTGLKGRNGVEIYEGDICQYRDDANIAQVGVVTCYESPVAFYIEAVGGDDEGNQDINLHPDYNIVVFGNIYENPEMLEL